MNGKFMCGLVVMTHLKLVCHAPRVQVNPRVKHCCSARSVQGIFQTAASASSASF